MFDQSDTIMLEEQQRLFNVGFSRFIKDYAEEAEEGDIVVGMTCLPRSDACYSFCMTFEGFKKK